MQYQFHLMIQSRENGQKTRLCQFGSFKKGFSRLLNDPTQVITWTNHGDYSVLSEYEVSTQSNAQKSRKWPETSFLAIWIIQKGIFEVFEWSIMTDTMAKWCRPFSSIIICNIKSNQWTKLEKITKNLIFCSFLHNLHKLCIIYYSGMTHNRRHMLEYL